VKLTIWLNPCSVFFNHFLSNYSDNGDHHKHNERPQCGSRRLGWPFQFRHRCTLREPDQIVQIANAHILQLSNHLWFEIPIRFVITIELILIATIVGIGSIVGLTTLRNAINSELADVSDAIEGLEWREGDEGSDSATATDSCISFSILPSDEV